ncbi:phage anti-RecBCD protein [Escherichia coli]|uniref:phage anti-RecBCD protein n=1 Tax=Escherichia coli TaxID=562 RepID=UPI000C23ABDF|nr:phage anti-RecBCD protein [Escherichia coli]PJI60591.1 RecBCD nuclease inhibitor [Escherichia coli]PJI65523.1 RecBCD nuclease inhibitor [Escherichia coli]
MPAPLYGANDPRRCSGSSKAEVLENIKNNFDAFLALTPETKAERMYRRDIQLAEKQEKDRINETSIRPFRKATYTNFPEYIDPRLRNYRSRYGAISND